MKVMAPLLNDVGVPPVSPRRTADNVSTVGINLPHLRAEIKAILKVGHRGISAWLRARELFNLHGATRWTERRMEGLEMDLRVCKNVARHKQRRQLLQ